MAVKSIPKNTGFFDRQLRTVLEALTHNQEVRFLRKSSEKVVTIQDLLDLGIITNEQAEELSK